MKFYKQNDGLSIHAILLILLLVGFSGAAQASFDSDFVHKYTELNLGNWGYRYHTFPDSNDKINAFNRSVSVTIPMGQSYPVNADFSTQMTLRYGSNFWQWTDNNGVISAKPRANMFSAGIGWNMGFGRLIAPANNPYGLWVYESAAGKIIRFYDNFSGEASVANVFYSHDSPKLRLKVVSSTRMTLEFTSGELHEFRQQEGNWEIYKRSDQFGNYQSFNWANLSTLNRVTTADNHGRVQWIHFKADPSGYYPRVIDKIRLTRFGSGVASHTFNYSTTTISTPAEDNDSATPATITVPILTSITHPLGEVEIFAYATGSVAAGRLRNYTNRYGGRVRYYYANVNMPLVQNPANLNQSLDHFAANVVGVTKRRAVNDVVGGILGNWTFSTTWHTGVRNAAPSLSQPTGMISEMARPDGFTEKQYFRVPINDIAVTSPVVKTVDKSEYGYPGLVHDWVDADESAIYSAAGTLFELKRWRPSYACTNCIDPNPKTWVSSVKGYPGGYLKRKVFNTWNWADRAGYQDSRDNWTIKRSISLVQTTSMPAVSALWITKPSTKTTVTEGTYSKISERCVNSLGQITRRRQVRGTAQASNDFIQEMVYDASGNATEGKYFGGDSQAVANGSLCSIALPTPQYRTYTNWSKGSVSGEGYLTASGAIAKETKVRTIDGPTGLTVSTHSGDGLSTTYGYDKNLRFTSSILPAGLGGQSTLTISPRSGATYATVTTTNKTNDGLMTLAQTIKKYDSFGRVIETKKQGPAGWAVTSRTYDSMGRLSTATNERGGVTQYLNRDYKGRVGIKRPPEGSVHDVSYTYSGDKVNTHQVSIAKDLTTNPPVEEFRTTTNTKDIFGRVIITTISDQDGAVRTRNTTYALNGKWVTKSQGATSVTNLNQYDAYGLLKVDSRGSSHTYNARGQSLEDFSKYGDKVDLVYDAAGRLTNKNAGGINYVNYQYASVNSSGEYNKGKLISASRVNPSIQDLNGTVTVTDTFEYKGRGGKVSQRTTTIKGPGAFGTMMTSASSVIYNDALGVLSYTSPSCTGSVSISCPWASAMTYNYSYNLGHLTSVADDTISWISNILYNTAGNVTGYNSGNGTSTELYYASDIEEPNKAIVRDNGLLVWDSGVAAADGGAVVHHYGASQEIPDDFYQTSTLPTQPTTYPSKDSNYTIDPLGMTSHISSTTICAQFSPCYHSSVFNASNDVIWWREKATWFPQTAVLGESRITITDVLNRPSTRFEGFNDYIFGGNPNFWRAKLHYTNENIYLDRHTLMGTSSLTSTDKSFSHLDFSGSSVGSSTETGEFTPTQSF